MKKKTKRSFPIFDCTMQHCHWKGTRLDKHLVSKVHGLEKREAKRIAKSMRKAQSRSKSIQTRAKNMYTASSLSEEFLGWFQTIEGGNFIPDSANNSKKAKRQQQNKKYKHMVETVLRTAYGDQEFHKSSLQMLHAIGRKAKSDEKSVIEKLQEGRTWGTVKNYLCAFTHFLDFLEATKLLDKDAIASVRLTLKGSIQTVTKLSMEEMQRRKLNDRDRVLDFSHISQYLQTNFADSLLKSFSIAPEESDKSIRDKVHRIGRHIMLELALQNGKRAGVFNDLTCEEVEQAVQQDEGLVISIAEGKTFKNAGAASIFCSESEFRRIEHYCKSMRPLLKPSSQQLFCRISGDQAGVGETGDFLNDAWTDFGLTIEKDVGSITFTLIRKTIVSKSRMEGVSKEEEEEMARHMDHSRDTANKYYDVSTGARLTAKFRKTLGKFYDPTALDSDSENEVIPSDNFDKNNSSEIAEKRVMIEAVKRPNYKQIGHSLFSDEDKVSLYRACANVIGKYQKKDEKSAGVTRSEILSQIKSAGPNFAFLLKKYTISQICNRVRCEIRKKVE
jgi:hypothetical protein